MSTTPVEPGIGDLVPRMKDQGYDQDRVARRRHWVEERTGATLRHVGSFSVDSLTMRGNIENPIGVAQVPIGVAGPVLVRGLHANGTFYVPMATTEGALVRSYERGMMTLTRSGGVEAVCLADQNQTNPSFFFDSIREAMEFTGWLGRNFPDVQRAAEATTRHGKLLSFETYQVARQVIVNFRFSTGDAQGMNMIVKATDAACRWIAAQLTIPRYLLFSGMSSEKRPSGYLLSRGKGKWVSAGALLPDGMVRSYLNCSAQDLYQVWHSTLVGHLAANAVGYNGQLANGLTAIFIATGQDVANVVNSACGITNFELAEGGVYVSVTLPALTVATVGGGTGLGTQRECLEMLGCHGSGKAQRFAEIVAASVLGGEISMAGAIASGDFATAHEIYGRNRPEEKA
ncbi:MAG: hydroxymethylglutaryl-CoA reductase [Acidobacteriota bacterium]